ncbi:MAG: Universal stress protein family protein [Syntrophorhabdus sp. PtaU1.Bin050]|nr:MAG: Universal stress protein family protein [Syntrophorhabdus sp. PtaU1.Bin050]
MANDISYIVVFVGMLVLCSFVEIGRKGLKTILVPTDFSESSDVALQIAIDLAKQQSARIYLLHVGRFRQVANEMEMMQKQLAKFPEAKFVDIVPEIRKGKVYQEILKMQTERSIDLIVIARHRKTESLYTVLRSVTEKVKKRAQCSVLVIGA